MTGFDVVERVVDGRPVLVWAPGGRRGAWRTVSTAVSGGGWGPRHWWLNASVEGGYARTDPQAHVAEIAAALRLRGPGVGMLTAADVRRRTFATDGGAQVAATVGLGVPVLAAAPDDVSPRPAAGTINLLVVVPVPLADGALVNLVVTATEAKTQALAEAGVPGTGTASDAVCVACPAGDGPVEPFGGPRSTWGARVARAVHRAVADGTTDWLRGGGTLSVG